MPAPTYIVILGFLVALAGAAWQFGPVALAVGGVVLVVVGLFGLPVRDRSS